MYRPIDIGAEDGWKMKREGKKCRFDEKPIGESHSEKELSTFPTRNSQESTSEIGPETMMNFGASRS
jgi:hypothetical protein